jgi:hypothetical protein
MVASARQSDWTAVRVHRDTAAALVALRDQWVRDELIGVHPRDERERAGLDRVIQRLIAEVMRHRAAAAAQRQRAKDRRRASRGAAEDQAR